MKRLTLGQLKHKSRSLDDILGYLDSCLKSGDCPPDYIDDIIDTIDRKYLSTANILERKNDGEITPEEVYDFIIKEKATVIVAFSGGKDSVAIVLEMLDRGVPVEQMELWHHEVDGMGEDLFDWKSTPSYCRAFAKAFNIPILFSYRKGGIIREVFKDNETSQNVYFQNEEGGEFIEAITGGKEATRKMFPAVAADLNARWCSAVAKIDVMKRAIANLPRLERAKLVIATGERRAESTKRSKYFNAEMYAANNIYRKAIQFRPVIEMSDEQVWGLMEKYKVQAHPAYMIGWSRCSCQLCIFQQKNHWASVNEISPEKIERLKAIEKEIDFTFYNKKSISEMVEAGKSFLSLADMYWIKQSIGEFTAPIIVDKWKRPLGADSSENCGAS